MDFKAKDVIVIGRSIGSGPGCHIASKNAIGSLVLVSPFKSIKSVVKSVLGRFAVFFIADRFKNNEYPFCLFMRKKTGLYRWNIV